MYPIFLHIACHVKRTTKSLDPQSYVSAHEMRNAAKDVETDVKGKDVADKPIPRKAKSHRRTQAAIKRRRQEGKSTKVQSAVKEGQEVKKEPATKSKVTQVVTQTQAVVKSKDDGDNDVQLVTDKEPSHQQKLKVRNKYKCPICGLYLLGVCKGVYAKNPALQFLCPGCTSHLVYGKSIPTRKRMKLQYLGDDLQHAVYPKPRLNEDTRPQDLKSGDPVWVKSSKAAITDDGQPGWLIKDPVCVTGKIGKRKRWEFHVTYSGDSNKVNSLQTQKNSLQSFKNSLQSQKNSLQS